MTKLIAWIKRPASILQFWRPQSGFLGGLLFAAVALNTCALIVWWFK